jgi:hypothetical protein
MLSAELPVHEAQRQQALPRAKGNDRYRGELAATDP